MVSPVTVPRWRRIAFYVIGAALLAMILGLLWPFLAFIALAWAPVETWQALFPAENIDASAVAHRIHELSFSLIFWGLVIGVGLQLWKPEKRQAPMLQPVAVFGAFLVIDLVSGTFEPLVIPMMVGVALLLVLHPARESLFQFRKLNGAMAGLAAVAVIPAAVFVLDHIDLQRLNTPGDEHAELGHWATMATLAVVIVLWAFIGATDRTGWKVTAWLAGISAAAYGIASLVFPDAASTASSGWAVATIAWGVGYIALSVKRAEFRSRQSRIQPGKERAEAKGKE